jgi:hypothetical protein
MVTGVSPPPQKKKASCLPIVLFKIHYLFYNLFIYCLICGNMDENRVLLLYSILPLPLTKM